MAGFDAKRRENASAIVARFDYANRRLLTDLQAAVRAAGAAWWKQVAHDRLRGAAMELLRADSARLRAGLGPRS